VKYFVKKICSYAICPSHITQGSKPRLRFDDLWTKRLSHGLLGTVF